MLRVLLICGFCRWSFENKAGNLCLPACSPHARKEQNPDASIVGKRQWVMGDDLVTCLFTWCQGLDLMAYDWIVPSIYHQG